MKEVLTDVNMSVICKRSEFSNQKESYEYTDKVTVLGLVCGKMSERVVVVRQEQKDRQESVRLDTIIQENPGEPQDKDDDEDGFSIQRQVNRRLF